MICVCIKDVILHELYPAFQRVPSLKWKWSRENILFIIIIKFIYHYKFIFVKVIVNILYFLGAKKNYKKHWRTRWPIGRNECFGYGADSTCRTSEIFYRKVQAGYKLLINRPTNLIITLVVVIKEPSLTAQHAKGSGSLL